MNCATHSSVPAAAYCRACGKALCEECKREVRGVIYCEECIAKRMEATMPTAERPAVGVQLGDKTVPLTGSSNPVAATLLGFIPGVGQMYNGEFGKAFVYVIIFGSLCWAGDRADAFGWFAAFFYFYMIFDAYRTAKARQQGQPEPADIFGMGGGSSASGSAVAREFAHVPIGAVVLIGLGALFLLDNMGLFHVAWIGRLWPLILVAIGIRMYQRRSTPAQNGRAK